MTTIPTPGATTMRTTPDHNASQRTSWTCSTIERLHQTTPTRHALIVVVSFTVLGAVNGILNTLYAASKHPVGYAEGQTSFSAQQIEAWYGAMDASSTLDTYLYTQIFDYAFMVTLAGFAIALASAITRGLPRASALRKTALTGATAVLAGATFDAIENLWSFAMIAMFNASNAIPSWLAVVYSATAVAKFVAITIGGVLLIASGAARIASIISNRRS